VGSIKRRNEGLSNKAILIQYSRKFHPQRGPY
jgi:hypothetical protein